MREEDIIEGLKSAARDGTLMTPKHDPVNLGATFDNYRTYYPSI